MIDCLLTEEQLAGADKDLAGRLSQDKSIRWKDLSPTVGQAYGRYALFTGQTLREKLGLPELTPLDAFYNAYYWIVVFSKRYEQQYGSDAGIRQQVFKILETAPANVDWKVVEEIANIANA